MKITTIISNIEKWIYVFSVVFLIHFSINAQTNDPIIQKLLDSGLISQNDIHKLEELLEGGAIQKEIIYAHYYFMEEYKKAAGNNSKHNTLSLYNSVDSFNLKEQTQINTILNEIILNLKNIDFIGDYLYKKFKSNIAESVYSNYWQFISDLEIYLAFQDLFQPVNLKAFATNLKNNGLLESDLESLIADIDDGKISNFLHFLNYCKNAIILRFRNDTIDVDNYLLKIHEKTATLLPELAFSNFKVATEVDSVNIHNGCIIKYFIVSLEANGKIYKLKCPTILHDFNNNLYQFNLEQQIYYKIFNKILRDNQSPYRLHMIGSVSMDSSFYEEFGIIALTEKQVNYFEEESEFFLFETEDYHNILTNSQINKVVANIEKSGLLSKLNNDQIKKATEKVLESQITEPNDILLAFPNIHFTLPTFLQTFTNPFKEIITHLANLSNLEFNPSNIIDSLDETKQFTFTVNFKFRETEYKKQVVVEGGMIDLSFIDMLNEVVTENKLSGKFYKMKPINWGTPIVYLTHDQYNFLINDTELTFFE